MTPQEAEKFYEPDEDPAKVIARFDAAPHLVTRQPVDPATQIKEMRDYITTTYGERPAADG